MSKVGQHVQILDLEEFGKSLFIDKDLQVASSDAADRGGLVDNRLGKNVLKLIHVCFLNKIPYLEK